MRIRHISIRNFRGIRSLSWSVPDQNIVCLVGRGDSGKSTVLEAIRRVFHPQWNLTFDDADFFNCDHQAPIQIEIVLGDIPDTFRDLSAYGHWLCGWNKETRQRQEDPGDGAEDALRVKLSVAEDLEPHWTAIKLDADEGIPFKPADRAKAAVTLLGAISDRHLTWSRGSILSRLTEPDGIALSLAGAARAAKVALEGQRREKLGAFDAVAAQAEQQARALGVNIAHGYKAHLDSDAINVRAAGLALHDGDLPLRQLGLGSKRMVATGLQRAHLRVPHITLFDEVEIGLEPHRISRLLQHLKDDNDGQYFLTSHSPVVLRELTVNDLHIVHVRGNQTNIVAANKPSVAESIQGKIRASAEAFLAPNILVCEGATEVGFLRGLDRHWTERGKPSLAYQGVALFNANGARSIVGISEALRSLSYAVAVLADSDDDQNFSEVHATALRQNEVFVTKWDGAVSIENRVFADVPWQAVLASIDVALRYVDRATLLDQVRTQDQTVSREIATWIDSPGLRAALGRAAKASEWFKSQGQTRAAYWALAIAPFLEDAQVQGTDLVGKLVALRDWIDRA